MTINPTNNQSSDFVPETPPRPRRRRISERVPNTPEQNESVAERTRSTAVRIQPGLAIEFPNPLRSLRDIGRQGAMRDFDELPPLVVQTNGLIVTSLEDE